MWQELNQHKTDRAIVHTSTKQTLTEAEMETETKGSVLGLHS